MSYIKSIAEITEEEYNKLITVQDNDRKTFHEMIEDISYKKGFHPNAYGCELPMRVYEEDGKYFASWNRWDSCD
jgi:hypothetical protein